MTTIPTTRFLLDGAAPPLLVQCGSVDLFLVDVVNGEAAGALFYVMSVTSPGVIFGMPSLPTKTGSLSLFCQPRTSTELIEARNDSGEAKTQWLSAVAAASGIEADAVPTEEISIAHRAMLAFAASRSESERAEALRLERKDDARGSTVHRALHQLSKVLGAEDAFTSIPKQSESELVAVCDWIGERQGFKLRTPKSFRSVGDPIRDTSALARASGIRYREVTLIDDWWKQDAGTLLAFRVNSEGDTHPVALVRKGRGYALMQAGTPGLQPVTKSVAASLAPRAVMFYRPFPPEPLTWKHLLRFGLFDTWRDGLVVIGIGASVGLLALVTPLATGLLFDTIIPGAQRSQLYQMAVLLFTANMVTFLISLSSGAAMQRMEGRMEASVQSAVWDRLLSLPVRFFSDYNSGDLVTRSLAIGEIRRMLTSTALSSMLSGVFSIFSFGLLFHYSTSLALVATVMVVITALISVACGWLQMRYHKQMLAVSGKISGLTLELMTGIAKLRMSGTESQAFARWADKFAQQQTVAVRSARVSMITTIFNSVFPSVSSIAIFYFGLNMMESGSAGLTPGAFVAFNAAFGQFLGASLGLAGTAISCIAIVPSYERAKPILQAIPERTGAQIDPGKLRGSIEVDHVVFRYKPELPVVLNDVSLHIKPGQFVAFVGHSGSGKSTLFRLLLGFEKPESGMISFDAHGMDDIEPQALRRQMGVVLQSGRVFDGDIFTNIIGSAPLTVEDAWAAARAAGFDRDIQAMPMGLHTVISEGGGGLSGGQRQRLLIARAIVHRPTILLFDEATSALDNQTQAIVSRSLEELKATRIVIAHRLSTIMNADAIYVFDAGRIVQQGTYEELIGQEGRFKDLAKRQIA